MIRSVIQGVAQVHSRLLGCPAIASSLSMVETCDVQKISPPTPFNQQVRTTYILKRANKVRLTKVHESYNSRSLKPKERIYELEENTINRKKPPLKIILMNSVEGLGSKGDVVETSRKWARNNLLLTGLAVYASPENIEKYAHLLELQGDADQPSSPFARKTAEQMSLSVISVSMNLENSWVVEPWHIRVAFRKAGIIVPEEAITIPSQPIKGPDMNLQGKEFLVKVKINNREEAPVRCRLNHVATNMSNRLPHVHEHWRYPAEPIFPEEGPILEELTKNNRMTIYEEEEH